ncbi:SDR family oxidoreductase [Bacillus carboniphilus]|uniref:SDR family oxidoreductase n=1 Tax=Bacillus carboniphilus TaxID=86663 RepID=A0ABY9JWS8_9BACI|nr:SDR family oxidoreductase [Bacillus carboniphilus]WLR43841.1 SDR family oxidoreductase [Bacillus carboniphilus]
MLKSLENKIIVITGASSGIGQEMAYQVASLGAKPILLARSEEKLINIVEEIKRRTSVQASLYRIDVTNHKQVREVFQKIRKDEGFVDILVNNAGFGVFDFFLDASLSDLKGMLDVNVLGLMACTKEVLPFMIEQNRGHIINIASQAGKIATPKSSGYAASKHAVLGFTNSLRMELKETNIVVSSVNPGPIKTNFFKIADKSGDYVNNAEKYMLEASDVAKKITRLMIKPKRELNLPWWMNMGSVLFHLSPTLFELVSLKYLNKK